MSAILPVVGFSIVGIAIVLLILTWKYRDSDLMRRDTDYKAFFWMGLIWMVIGGPVIWITSRFEWTGLFSIGLIFFIAGLANRDKWDKKRKLSQKEMRFRLIAIVAGIIILLAVIYAFMMLL